MLLRNVLKETSKRHRQIDRQLAILKSNLNKHYSLLVTSGGPVTAVVVKNSFAGITEHSRTLCEVIDFF